jgi:uncharacterized protein YraI
MALDNNRTENGETTGAGETAAAAVPAPVPDAPSDSAGPEAAATADAPSAEAAREAGPSAAAARVRRYSVAPGYRLNVRSGPGTNFGIVRVLPYNATVPINCQTPGEWISGPYGTTNIWDNIANGEWVSDAYVLTGSDGYVTIRC